ncbi:unnamed protein product [Thelazia callipaeda]|uniref:polynucleotide adenylyltransferase n=1 Tax=Thelazia callipaeda TaxID=103827 RepID=A0A0N5D339_THECL|nr:unnamed protein product [Thelazia callipaeda]
MFLKTDVSDEDDQCDSVPSGIIFILCSSSSEEDKEPLSFIADSSDRVYWPPRESTASVAPWCRRKYSLSFCGLHEELIDLYEWLKPSPLEKALRFCVFERVREVLQRIWPTAKIGIFGSLYTNLFLPSSDIDVFVESDSLSEDLLLQKTAETLKGCAFVKSIYVLNKAFVPIVKVVDRDTQIYLDISFNTSHGIRAAQLIEEMKIRYPVLEPLVLILKQFLMQRNLNQVFSGGLSSYALILMSVSFLQLHPSYDYTFKSIKEVNMGLLLMSFLQLYGQEFNYMQTALSIRNGGAYVSRDRILAQMSKTSNSMLCIEDPLLPDNDIGRCSHNIQLVRQAFQHALSTLCSVFIKSREHSALWRSSYCGSILSLILHIPSHIIYYRNWLKGRVVSDESSPPLLSDSSSPESLSPVFLSSSIIPHSLSRSF